MVRKKSKPKKVVEIANGRVNAKYYESDTVYVFWQKEKRWVHGLITRTNGKGVNSKRIYEVKMVNQTVPGGLRLWPVYTTHLEVRRSNAKKLNYIKDTWDGKFDPMPTSTSPSRLSLIHI